VSRERSGQSGRWPFRLALYRFSRLRSGVASAVWLRQTRVLDAGHRRLSQGLPARKRAICRSTNCALRV